MSNVAIRLQCLYNKNINARKAYRQQQQQQQPNYQTGHSQSHENSLCQRYLAASNNCVLFTLIYSEACLLLVIILAPYHFHRCGNRARYCLTTHTHTHWRSCTICSIHSRFPFLSRSWGFYISSFNGINAFCQFLNVSTICKWNKTEWTAS